MTKDHDLKVLRMMVEMYCHGNHKTKKHELCQSCEGILLFSEMRRAKCPYGDNKKNYCSQCKIHCYQSNPEMRAKIKAVMRYSACRMMFTHPILSISHLHQTIHGKIAAKRAARKEAKLAAKNQKQEEKVEVSENI